MLLLVIFYVICKLVRFYVKFIGTLTRAVFIQILVCDFDLSWKSSFKLITCVTVVISSIKLIAISSLSPFLFNSCHYLIFSFPHCCWFPNYFSLPFSSFTIHSLLPSWVILQYQHLFTPIPSGSSSFSF